MLRRDGLGENPKVKSDSNNSSSRFRRRVDGHQAIDHDENETPMSALSNFAAGAARKKATDNNLVSNRYNNSRNVNTSKLDETDEDEDRGSGDEDIEEMNMSNIRYQTKRAGSNSRRGK